MAVTETGRREPYAEEYVPGETEDARAVEHHQAAVDALTEGREGVAVVEALLAIAERISELSVYVSHHG